MENKVVSVIQLMEDDKVFYTIEINNLTSYQFLFDTDAEKPTTLYLNIPNLNMSDLDVLVRKPYESYVLIGTKKILVDGKERKFAIPPRVYKRMCLRENGESVEITFYER